MRVSSIPTFYDLCKLAGEWNDLYQRSAATPFQLPEWILPWWRFLGSGEMFGLAAREQGRLVGLAPLFLHPWNGRRQVTFLGNGVSDRLGFVLDPHYAAPTTAAFLDVIASQRERWDLCDLQDLPAAAPLCRAAAPAVLGSAVRPQYSCMSIPLPGSYQEFHEGLPHGVKRNLKRYRDRLDKLGEVTFETRAGGIGELLDALVALHRVRWQSKGEAGMVCGVSMERFHREAAAGLARRGLVRLHGMRVGGRICSVIYVLFDRGRVYSYLSGFDPELARFSPGALLLEYAIQQAIASGARVYDLLRGDEKYKYDWGARDETSYRLLLWHDKAPVDLLEAA